MRGLRDIRGARAVGRNGPSAAETERMSPSAAERDRAPREAGGRASGVGCVPCVWSARRYVRAIVVRKSLISRVHETVEDSRSGCARRAESHGSLTDNRLSSDRIVRRFERRIVGKPGTCRLLRRLQAPSRRKPNLQKQRRRLDQLREVSARNCRYEKPSARGIV